MYMLCYVEHFGVAALQALHEKHVQIVGFGYLRERLVGRRCRCAAVAVHGRHWCSGRGRVMSVCVWRRGRRVRLARRRIDAHHIESLFE